MAEETNEQTTPADGGQFEPPRGSTFDEHIGGGEKPKPRGMDVAEAGVRLAVTMEKPAVLTWILAGLMLAFYAAMLAYEGFNHSFSSGSFLLAFSPETLARWGAIVTDKVKDGEIGRLVTGSWIYFGHLNALLALICFVSLGRFIEKIYGKFYLVTFFVLLGAISGAAGVMLGGNPVVPNSFGPVYGIVGVMFGFSFRWRKFLSAGFVFLIRFQFIFWLFFYSALELVAYNSFPAGIVAGSIVGSILGLLVAPRIFRPPLASVFLERALAAVSAIFVVFSLAAIGSYGTGHSGWRPQGLPGGYGKEFRGYPPGNYAPETGEPGEFFEITGEYTNPEYGYSVFVPGRMQCKKLGKQIVRLSIPQHLFILIAAADKTPYSSKEFLIGNFTDEFLRSCEGLNPELLEKGNAKTAGGFEYAYAIFRVANAGWGRNEIRRIIAGISGERVYEINVQYFEDDAKGGETADFVVNSFRPAGE